MEKADKKTSKEQEPKTCIDCGHTRGQCECLCCCPVSKIGCPTCIGPVLAYRGIKKIIHKIKQ